ncbi:hypothetical protein [Actinoplanes sp. M2I2]|uniref:hypothetical protein n=1 Tax=Actinoplanes sp. M2I2 TaxID=1734444 RepID=UPI00202288AC|nr:hypothetical protein [Actinoplanes sp. M2I2]
MTTVATRISVPTRSRAGGWVLVAAQAGFAALYAICCYLALARAAELAGRWYLPSQDDPFTADLDVTGAWPWAWVVAYVVSSALMVTVLSLFVSAIVFLSGYARGHRRLRMALAGSTAATFLVLVVSLTPAAQLLAGWLLD